jgi:DNA-binding SARP family transcriptional activator
MRPALSLAQGHIEGGAFECAEALLRELAEGGELAGADAREAAHELARLCVAAGEHQRLARRLDAAAHRHRDAEEQLRREMETMFGRRVAPSPPRPPSQHAAVTADVDVDVRVLGPLEAVVHGRRITRWGSLKARAVLQYLVIHADRPVRREILMETYWPRHTHNSSRNNLNVALSSLRRTLQNRRPRTCVLFAEGCYLLNPDLVWRIDQTVFLADVEAARASEDAGRRNEAIAVYGRAVRLYRGPLFEDDTTSEWYLPNRRQLEEVYLQALERFAELHLVLGDPAAAEDGAQRALATDPCRESSHRLLMRCYAGRHQHHLVPRQLQICASVLRRELGISPAPETLDVCEALTARAPSLIAGVGS